MKLSIREYQLLSSMINLTKMLEKKIWKNFLTLADVTIDTDMLAETLSTHELNGRQIRTAIQLAQALAQSETVDISLEHVERTLAVSSQFDTDLGWDKADFLHSDSEEEKPEVTEEKKEVKVDKKKKKKSKKSNGKEDKDKEKEKEEK